MSSQRDFDQAVRSVAKELGFGFSIFDHEPTFWLRKGVKAHIFHIWGLGELDFPQLEQKIRDCYQLAQKAWASE